MVMILIGTCEKCQKVSGHKVKNLEEWYDIPPHTCEREEK